MTLAIFDLDNTLIAGDSDYLWGEFLVEQNLVDATEFKEKNDQFYQDYVKGQLNIYDYIAFSLSPLAKREMSELKVLHQRFMREKIQPIILPKARALIEEHRAKGHTLLVITATNRFVTEPIVQSFGIDNLLAIELEIIDGNYSGKSVGVPSFQEGKVTRLNEWLAQNNHDLKGAYFYSDSHNDIPLLECVDHPVIVDGDEALLKKAAESGWPALSLRG